ncbi:MAG: RimK family alpha-L-glutamate ligase [Oscillospiraceae bacterium]|nr:RimK family alpha-L-glutamate ligase [Oscillospiraceae bacterium]
MKKGYLITNAFLKGETYSAVNRLYLDEAKRQGLDISLITNADIPMVIENGAVSTNLKGDFAIFLDKDITLATALEKSGMRLFNPAESIRVCDDKSLTHLALAGQGIPMPKTIIAPKTFENIGFTDLSFLQKSAEIIGFPIIVKECFGSFGMQVYMAKNLADLEQIVAKISPRPFIMQEFIKSSSGRDVRLNVVGGKVVASMLRTSKTDFRANYSIGGDVAPYTPTNEQIALAIRCCELLSLDFAGVDVLFGDGGEPILCEINSNAHILGVLKSTGVNVAEHIIRHIIDTI